MDSSGHIAKQNTLQNKTQTKHNAGQNTNKTHSKIKHKQNTFQNKTQTKQCRTKHKQTSEHPKNAKALKVDIK